MVDKVTRSSVMIRASEADSARQPHRRESAVTASVATKLVRDTRTGAGNRNYAARQTARTDVLYGVSERIASNTNDIENIFEVLPETERCEMILTSCILSPDDMKTVDLRYLVERTGLPASVQSGMLAVMEEFGTKTYKIKDKLPKILSRALFKSGSYPIMCIPESSLDLLINHDNRISLESAQTLRDETAPKGILGDNNRVMETRGAQTRSGFSMESMIAGSSQVMMTDNRVLGSLTVGDNPNVIKLPQIQETVTRQRVLDAYHSSGTYGLESYDNDGRRLNDIARRLYVRRRSRTEDIVRIRTQEQTGRNSVGHPMIVDLSSDAVIPVANPSNMAEHFGYFVLLDGFGNPLNNTNDSMYSRQLEQRMQRNKTEASGVLEDIKKSMYGNCDCDADYRGAMYDDFVEYIERDLLERFDNGAMHGRSVQISRPNAVYQMMWARILANKQTQAVYVPRELMSYFAFDFNKLGIGKSLTDGTKILASIRALLLFATTRSAVRSAVGHKVLNLHLDPEISDPSKWVQQMVHEYIRVNNGNYPLGTSDPNDIMSYMEQAGISVNVENHPGYPEVKANVESVQSATAQIDPEIDRELRNRHISRYGLPPEVVDASTGVDFAATIRTSNVFLDKQITQYKEKLCDQVSEHFRMLAVNSGTIMSDLFNVIDELADQIPEDLKVGDWRADMVIEFLENFYVDLPDSNNTKLETQLQKISVYSQILDAVMVQFATPEILMSLDPAQSRDDCESAVNIMKQHFMREYIISEGILPEVTDVMTWPGDEEEPAFDFMRAQTSYIEALGNTLRNLFNKTKELREKQNPEAADGGNDSWGGNDGGSSWGNDYNDNANENENETNDGETSTTGGTQTDAEAEGGDKDLEQDLDKL